MNTTEIAIVSLILLIVIVQHLVNWGVRKMYDFLEDASIHILFAIILFNIAFIFFTIDFLISIIGKA